MTVLTQAQNHLALSPYGPKTRAAYASWIRRYCDFWEQPEPEALNEATAWIYLRFLATQRKVAASTHNQARQALAFLFNNVLTKDTKLPGRLKYNLVHRKAVFYLNRKELDQIIRRLPPEMALIASLLRESGLRIGECLHLRVRDIDFENQCIRIRELTGKDVRLVRLPPRLTPVIRNHLQNRMALWRQEKPHLTHASDLPANIRKYFPKRSNQWPWQFVFCDPRPFRGPRQNTSRQVPLQTFRVRTAVREAATPLQFHFEITPEAIRHSAAVHLLQDGFHPRALGKLLGHNNLLTTLLYTARMNPGTPGLLMTNDHF